MTAPILKDLSFAVATEADASALAALRTAAAEQLTREYGRSHWSSGVSEKDAIRAMKGSRVLVAREGPHIVATLTLQTKKPWAINPAYFTPVRHPLYLTSMAVEPAAQRRGIGRRLVHEAQTVATVWPSDAIRLDAYDAAAGAGGFYAKCGFREVGRVTYRKTPLIYFEWLASADTSADTIARESSSR
jgi:ribosomal protein S18 acetylase RimI-like enzyme